MYYNVFEETYKSDNSIINLNYIRNNIINQLAQINIAKHYDNCQDVQIYVNQFNSNFIEGLYSFLHIFTPLEI